MDPRLQELSFFSELTESEIEIFSDDPLFDSLYDQWTGLERSLSQRLNLEIPDRHILVLYALAESDPSYLTSDEERLVREERENISALIATHRSLRLVVDRIREDAEAFEAEWDNFEVSETRIYRLTPAIWQWSAGIAAALVFGLLFFFMLSRNQAPQGDLLASLNGPGQFELADGSIIHLQSGATIRYDDSGEFSRKVMLDGSAFFEVIHDESAPFVVTTPTAQTTVLGTQFGIEANENETIVTLATGSVLVSDFARTGQPIVLSPGEQVLVTEASGLAETEQVTLGNELDWSGFVFLSGATLDEACQTISRMYDVQISIDDRFKNQILSEGAVFQKSDFPTPESILQVVVGTVGARLTAVDGSRFTVQ